MNIAVSEEMTVNEAHLGYIQGVITRMGQNSFQCKAWCITLVSALLMLYLERPNDKTHPECVYISYAVIALFGFLDTYYLYLERGYRYLYEVVAKLVAGKSVAVYDMKIPEVKKGVINYFKSLLSVTTGLFYIVIIIMLFILLNYVNI